MLISYSTLELEAQYYVCNYLLDETQEVAFQDPLLDKVLQIFKIELGKGTIPTSDFFLKHPDGEVQRLAIDLTTERHELSPQWFDKHKIITPHERDNLTDAAYKTVLRLKQELIKKMVYENMLLLAKASDTGNVEEQTRCIQIHTELKAAEREIAGHLGNVLT
jgi:DNA primase